MEVEGVVGRIDIYEDIPTELKTTTNLSGETDLLKKRPYYIEQLGFYCSMVKSLEGRVVIYQRGATLGESLNAYRVRFLDYARIIEELKRRRDLLLEAIAKMDPTKLPLCQWNSTNCDYSSVCDCRSSQITSSNAVLAEVDSIDIDRKALEALIRRLTRPVRSCISAIRLNDLVFPRKSYISQLGSQDASETILEEDAAEYLKSMEKRSIQSVIRDAVRYGEPGESRSISVEVDILKDKILLYQNRPVTVRGSQFNSVVDRQNLVKSFWHYVMRVAMECGLADYQGGRLIVYYEKLADENSRLAVYDINFRDKGVLRDEALRRLHLLASAIEVSELPPCPAWMCRNCDRKARCLPFNGIS